MYVGKGVCVGKGAYVGKGVYVGTGVYVGKGVCVGKGAYVGKGVYDGAGVYVGKGVGTRASLTQPVAGNATTRVMSMSRAFIFIYATFYDTSVDVGAGV